MFHKRKPFTELSKRQQKKRIERYNVNRKNRDLLLKKFAQKEIDEGNSPNEVGPANKDCHIENVNCFDTSNSHNENEHSETFYEEVNVENETWFDLKSFLRKWSTEYHIPHNALSSLLKGLRDGGIKDLPQDARTLLHTPRTNTTIERAHGKFIHYGLEKSIKEQLDRIHGFELPQNICVNINIDGLPLFKSSSSEVWPLLGKIADRRFHQPFIISIWHGVGKPSSAEEFLQPFVDEYTLLNNEGFTYMDKRHFVSINVVIADTVARNFLGMFPAHNSRCWKCVQPGRTIEHRRLFIEMDATLRTHNTFRFDLPPQFKSVISPLEKINLDMINQVPLDPMHLVDLGVVKKILTMYRYEYGKNKNIKKVLNLNEVHFRLKQWFPFEINRKPRSFFEVDRYKATEFHTVALYTGPIIFKDYLPPNKYIHFMNLNAALRILSSPADCFSKNEVARKCLKSFVINMAFLYGEKVLIYNVHNLLHLCDDVLKCGPLYTFSAYPFENYLQILKRMIRKGDSVLTQIINRIAESNYSASESHTTPNEANYILMKESFPTVPLPTGFINSYGEIQFKTFMLSNKMPNNYCYLEDNSVVCITSICHRGDKPVIIGKKFVNPKAIDNFPFDSKELSMFRIKELEESEHYWYVEDIRKKGFVMPCDDYFYVFPLLHTCVE